MTVLVSYRILHNREQMESNMFAFNEFQLWLILNINIFLNSDKDTDLCKQMKTYSLFLLHNHM